MINRYLSLSLLICSVVDVRAGSSSEARKDHILFIILLDQSASKQDARTIMLAPSIRFHRASFLTKRGADTIANKIFNQVKTILDSVILAISIERDTVRINYLRRVAVVGLHGAHYISRVYIRKEKKIERGGGWVEPFFYFYWITPIP
jgi:hypothetical protein